MDHPMPLDYVNYVRPSEEVGRHMDLDRAQAAAEEYRAQKAKEEEKDRNGRS